MRSVKLCLMAVPSLLAVAGCSLANAAVDVATLPVKAVSKGVDLATTSQTEADQKRGREARKKDQSAGARDRAEADAEARWISECRRASMVGQPCPPPPPITPPAPVEPR